MSSEPKKILLHPPVVGDLDREYVVAALDSGWVAPAGPDLAEFEAELAALAGTEAALCLSAGSAGLHLGLLSLGIKPGDEVVVQSATFAATAFAVAHAGAVPVFCDSESTTGNIDPELLDTFLADRASRDQLPMAVITVDLFGYCADYDRLRAVCDTYGVALLQDAAEAVGSSAQGAMAGSHGDLGVFSFNGNKVITTSGGGALLGPAEALELPRKLGTQAREPALHYEHEMIGYNYRLSNVLAALGRAQLASLDERTIARRRLHGRYVDELGDLNWFPQGVTTTWNHWISVGFLPDGVDPTETCHALDERGVECRPFWKPMHMQPVFDGNEVLGGDVSEQMFATGICLPSSHVMTSDDQDRVIDGLQSVLETA